jgi:predicted amidophosphoribosyltransferase
MTDKGERCDDQIHPWDPGLWWDVALHDAGLDECTVCGMPTGNDPNLCANCAKAGWTVTVLAGMCLTCGTPLPTPTSDCRCGHD